MNNNVALFHIFPLQSTANPCFSSLRGNGEEQESEQSGEAFSELSLGQSDQEGAIECLSERERRREGGRETEEVEEELDVHNRPRHECSSTLISTHPLQFQLSNRTSNSLLHPLTPRTEEKKLSLTHICVCKRPLPTYSCRNATVN